MLARRVATIHAKLDYYNGVTVVRVTSTDTLDGQLKMLQYVSTIKQQRTCLAVCLTYLVFPAFSRPAFLQPFSARYRDLQSVQKTPTVIKITGAND